MLLYAMFLLVVRHLFRPSDEQVSAKSALIALVELIELVSSNKGILMAMSNWGTDTDPVRRREP
jgi:hypothetical protein